MQINHTEQILVGSQIHKSAHEFHKAGIKESVSKDRFKDSEHRSVLNCTIHAQEQQSYNSAFFVIILKFQIFL